MRNIFIALTFLLIISSCSDILNVKEVEVTNVETTYAIPLFNSDINIVSLSEGINDNTFVEVKDDGKLVVHYEGEVNRKDAKEVFPSFPLLEPAWVGAPIYWPIPDTNYQLSMSLITGVFSEDGDIIVTKSKFKDNHLIFEFSNPFAEPIEVTVTMPGMIKDGVDFKEIFIVPASEIGFRSEQIALDNWILDAYNHIPFVYDARNTAGERVIMNDVEVNMDNFAVYFVEGYFGQNRFDLKSDDIDITVFNKWKSGGFSFENPTITLEVENSFGFPVRAKVNYMTFTTINNVEVQLESPLLTTMDFEYPNLNERGEVHFSYFEFNKDNSNVRDLFNDKVNQLAYDIDASANPLGDNSIIGFINEDSYFKINASVILPLEMSINELVLVDTFDLKLNEQDANITSAQFKMVNQNSMPFELDIQIYFLDEQLNIIDSLFDNKGVHMDAAHLNEAGEVIPDDEIITYADIDKAKYLRMKEAFKLTVEVKIDSENHEESLWLTEENGLITKLGVIINMNEE